MERQKISDKEYQNLQDLKPEERSSPSGDLLYDKISGSLILFAKLYDIRDGYIDIITIGDAMKELRDLVRLTPPVTDKKYYFISYTVNLKGSYVNNVKQDVTDRSPIEFIKELEAKSGMGIHHPNYIISNCIEITKAEFDKYKGTF